MKLVSVSAVLIASSNISLFVNTYIDQNNYPPLSLFLLSTIFSMNIDNSSKSSQLLRRYLWLFGAGLIVTFCLKSELVKVDQHPKLKEYTLLGQSLHYSILYYGLNVVLGVVYQHLFRKEYYKANKNRIQWIGAPSMQQENCSICLKRIEEGQKIAKIECIHLFHLICMNKWVKQKAQCPLCQTEIPLSQ